MNWSKIKTILILLFLFTDAFLLATILSSSKSEISAEIINSTVDILASNNIFIDSAVIPRKITLASHAEADNIIQDNLGFAALFVGDDAQQAPEENDYIGSNGSISLTGDSFHYRISENYDTEASVDEKTALRLAQDFMKERGFDLSHSKYTISAVAAGYDIIFNNFERKLPVFNSKITVQIRGSKVFCVYGSWFNASEEDGQDNELKSITGILIDFMPYVKNSEYVKISDLQLGYTIFEDDTYHKSAVLVPSWQISLADGRTYYIDARNAQ